MSATVQDILDKIGLLEIDRSNIRRAIIAKDVYVPTDVTISTYGDYIRMINPDIELEYVYAHQYTTPSRSFLEWTYEDLRPDLGIKPVMQLEENQSLEYVLYSNPWYKNPATVIMSNTPYTGSTFYSGYNLDFFEIRAEKWTNKNVDTITTGTPGYYSIAEIWPSLDTSTYSYYYKTRDDNDSDVDPRASFGREIWTPDDIEYAYPISIHIKPKLAEGDSLNTFDLDKTSNLRLDFNGCTYHGNYNNDEKYKKIQVRGGYSQKFSKLIINKVTSLRPNTVIGAPKTEKLHEFVPYIRFNPATGKYDQFVIKDKMNPNDKGSLIKWPWHRFPGDPGWLQTKPYSYTYDSRTGEGTITDGPNVEDFSFTYKIKS